MKKTTPPSCGTLKYKEVKSIPQTFPAHFPVLELALNEKWWG